MFENVFEVKVIIKEVKVIIFFIGLSGLVNIIICWEFFFCLVQFGHAPFSTLI